MRKRKKICILNAPLTTGNMGVTALALSTIAIMNDLFDDPQIYMFVGNKKMKTQYAQIGDRKIGVEVINYRLSPKAGFGEHLVVLFLVSLMYKYLPSKAVRKYITEKYPRLGILSSCDYLGDIMGGDSFSDIYGFGRFITSVMPALIVLNMKKDLVMLPQTYGPYRKRISRSIANHIIRKSRYAMARDSEGFEYINKLKGKEQKEQAIFCPDVAFTMKPTPDGNGLDIAKKEGSVNVGININGLLYNGGYDKKNMFHLKVDYKTLCMQIVSMFAGKKNHNIILIPHTVGIKGNINNDLDASYDLVAKLPDDIGKNVSIISKKLGPSEIKSYIGRCDVFVGSRMHACIASASQGIVTIPIAYSKKFVGVFDTIGQSNNVIDAREMNNEQALNRIKEIAENREHKTAVAEPLSLTDEILSSFKSTIEE